MKKQLEGFKSVTIFILATNETCSLKQTVSEIQNLSCVDDIEKLVIVLKNENCLSCDTAKQIAAMYEFKKPKVEIYLQKAKNIEGCIAELPWLVKSSHFIMMGADMEMNPASVKDFISRAKQHPDRIICASKWHPESTVKGYGKFHEIATRAMNTFVSLLFGTKVADPFSIYQIYPISVYRKMKFENSLRPGYEYTLKPLRCGIEYEEIPTIYRKSKERKSNFNFSHLVVLALTFCATAIRLRLTPLNKLLK